MGFSFNTPSFMVMDCLKEHTLGKFCQKSGKAGSEKKTEETYFPLQDGAQGLGGDYQIGSEFILVNSHSRL